MKVMLVNNSGNAGKSFFSREFFYPNMNNPLIVEVESNNSSSTDFDLNLEKINAKKLDKLNQFLLMNDDVIVDVGSSQIESFLENLKSYDDLLEEIDLIVVPVPQNIKIYKDSATVLDLLNEADLGIPIKIFLNQCDDIEEFDFFIAEAEARGHKIDENLIFEKFNVVKTLDEDMLLSTPISKSEKDFKSLAKEAYKSGDKEKGDDLADKHLIKGQCKAMRQYLDKRYAYLVSSL